MDVVSWMSISNSQHLIAKARKWLQNYVVALPKVSHEK